MVLFLSSVAFGFIATFVAVAVFVGLGRVFLLWRTLPERTVVVYTYFGKVIGEVNEPGMFFPIFHFGPKALLLPFFGKAYTVTTALQQSYLRNQLVNSEEGAPMGVGVWYEMYVQNCTAFLFQNSDPVGSLRANVATAVSRQLSNLELRRLRTGCALEQGPRGGVAHLAEMGIPARAQPTSGRWRFATGE